jgi:hypothetical protein
VVAGFPLGLSVARFSLMCAGKHARGSQPVCIRELCEWLANFEAFILMDRCYRSKVPSGAGGSPKSAS